MKVVAFGEVMGRMAAPGYERFGQCLPGRIDVTFAGAEANVAASLATLGATAVLVTVLPEHAIADACVAALRARGIDTRHILRRPGRLGLYFLETGANQRPSQVIYDREGSSISRTEPGEYAWSEILQGADWLHVSGITPAVSATAAAATLAALQAARLAGVRVSCDLNYRQKLWSWDPVVKGRQLAERTMRELLPWVDVVIANEEDCEQVLGIRAGQTDVAAGQLAADRYPAVAREVVRQFPQVSQVAITLRTSISASHNLWGGMLYRREDDRAYWAPEVGGSYQPYVIHPIVDRVGAGDAFAAGLIFATQTPELADPGRAIAFAVAASCLAHSTLGDFNLATRPEIESLVGGAASGRVVR